MEWCTDYRAYDIAVTQRHTLSYKSVNFCQYFLNINTCNVVLWYFVKNITWNFQIDTSMSHCSHTACSWFSKALGDVGASYQMQSHMVILIAYCIGMKEDHQTLLSFAVLAGKWQKNAPFDIKSTVKKFHSRAKGGHRTVPPLNTPLPTGRLAFCENKMIRLC